MIEAGIGEFGRNGFAGASTASIAAVADVPQPHVYANFSTKQDLFIACASHVCEQLLQEETADQLVYARFLFQLVASSQAPELSSEVRPMLVQLHEHLTAERFDELLQVAARSYLYGS